MGSGKYQIVISRGAGLAWPWDFCVRQEVLETDCALFAWLISHQPTVLFSQNKSATSNQPTVFFSQNKPASAVSHQPNEQAVGSRWRIFLSSFTNRARPTTATTLYNTCCCTSHVYVRILGPTFLFYSFVKKREKLPKINNDFGTLHNTNTPEE
jgi:hypothetical protein